MNKNLGTIDKVVRLLIAVAGIGVIAAGLVEGTLTIVVGVVVGIMVLTSLVSWCPLYMLVGLSSRKK